MDIEDQEGELLVHKHSRTADPVVKKSAWRSKLPKPTFLGVCYVIVVLALLHYLVSSYDPPSEEFLTARTGNDPVDEESRYEFASMEKAFLENRTIGNPATRDFGVEKTGDVTLEKVEAKSNFPTANYDFSTRAIKHEDEFSTESEEDNVHFLANYTSPAENIKFSPELEASVSKWKIDSQKLETILDKTRMSSYLEVLEYILKSPSFTYKTPLKFLDEYRNPCFHDPVKQEVVRCLPLFYLAGFPKCATTSLFRRLREHPEIFRDEYKEPHWWTRYRLLNESNPYYKNLNAFAKGKVGNMTTYVSFFDNMGKNMIAGDESVSTMWDNYLMRELKPNRLSRRLIKDIDENRMLPIHLIKAYTPKAKFIVMLRSPADRLYSDYIHFSQANETMSKENFHEHAVLAIREFHECLKRQNIHQCVYDKALRQQGHDCDHKIRIQLGIYVVFISDFLKVFPRTQLLFLKTEDYLRDRLGTLKKVFTFLKIGTDDKIMSKMNITVRPYERRPLAQKLGMMLPKTRLLLKAFYRPFNLRLAKLFGRDDQVWEDFRDAPFQLY